MKRGTIIVNLMLLSFCLLMTRCTDAFKDVQLIVNPDVFKYTTSIKISSSSGASMDDATVILTGQDIVRIYNMKGFRDFEIKDGLVSFGVDPNKPPLENDPIKFNVIIKKAGYSTINIPVVIKQQDSSSLVYVAMIDHTHPPEGIQVKTNYLTLIQGKVSKDTTIYVGPGTCTCTTAKATIGLKAGTHFKDASGNAIGEVTDIQITTLTVDAPSNGPLKYFPGGSLTQNKIEIEGGHFVAGTLLPAGLIELIMTANSKAIESFTTPMQVSIQLSPDYINPNTDQLVKVGDKLKVFSYRTDNGYFQYETTGTVFNQGGHLALGFSTTHLTWFMVGEFVSTYNEDADLGFKSK